MFRRRRFEVMVRELCAKATALQGTDDPLDNMLTFQYVPGKGWGGWVRTRPVGTRDRMVGADGKDTADSLIRDLTAAVDKLLADRDQAVARFTARLDETVPEVPPGDGGTLS